MDISQYTPTGVIKAREETARPAPPPPPGGGAAPSATAPADGDAGAGGLFDTLVDTLNPLQHIPGVSTVYRAATGDGINPLASMAGGFLFGGPVGLAAGAANSFFELVTGKSLIGHALALFDGADEAPAAGFVTTASVGDGSPLIQPDAGLSLQQYQTFAKAAAAPYTGIGAKADAVAWSANTWTQETLKQATGAYEASQNLGGGDKDRVARIV